jgi:hypothetical protein
MYEQVMNDDKIQEKSDLLATHGFVRIVKILKSNFICSYITLQKIKFLL